MAINLLVTAQREEGIRDELISALSIAGDKTFFAIFKTIVEKKLTRFASVHRSISNVFGFDNDLMTSAKLLRLMELAIGSVGISKDKSIAVTTA